MELSRQALLVGNVELKRQLQEAREHLEGLKVSSPKGEQVCILHEAEQTYHHLVENMNKQRRLSHRVRLR